MEEDLQKDKQEEHSSEFLRWKWWRPLYYVYFAGMVVAVVFLYSAQKHGKNNAGSPSAVATIQAKASSSQTTSPSSQPSRHAQLASMSNKVSRSAGSASATKTSAKTPEEVAEASSVSVHPVASGTGSSLSKYAFMMAPSKQIVEKGKSLFMNDCVACHGANGEGDGPAAAALNPKPRDFHSAKGWINGRMASDMFKTLTYGIKGSAMPPFSTISVKERLEIISYIRSFKGFPKETKADIKLLTKMIETDGGSAQGND